MKLNLPHTPSLPSATAFLFAACLSLAGCATHKPAPAQANAKSDSPFSFWQPYLLYLLPSPYSRLYVEVDAVEGCSPADDTLNRLREFLATHCKKQGGIELVRSDVIPRHQAVGWLPSALARKFLNGPPDNSAGPPPAFLYVLFYDDVLSDRPAVIETGHSGARTAKHSRLVNRNPHVDVLPYPAMVYMNARWGSKAVRDAALLHEAGHVLGLAFRPANASDGHCLSRTCLMNSSVHLVRFVLGLDHAMDEQLCERCLAQLAESRALPPPGNVRFVGPVLVRSEPGYHVLSLPHRAKVVLGDFSPQDCRDFAAAVRAETPSAVDAETERSLNASGSDELLRDPAKLRDLLMRLGADPDPLVRRVAPKLWTACAGQYYASGQFANAVEACRQAILADPEDELGYNLLAWVKATCADPSIRDGKEAVAAATKACELSHWKNCEWIDTLAAACAEAGDFKHAVQYQKQALRTGNPTESQRNAMRGRAALYEQSQPFRDQPANTPALGPTSMRSPGLRPADPTDSRRFSLSVRRNDSRAAEKPHTKDAKDAKESSS